MSRKQIEAKARELWKQRQEFILDEWGIKSKSWKDAPEGGRNLMRLHAKAGQQNWLDEVEVDPTELKKHIEKFGIAWRQRK